MAIIDDIKCPRCDRKYSGVRSRCPYCGARRIGFGKYSKDTDNAKGKMLISILILAVFAVAAGIMLFSTPKPVEEEPEIVEETPNLEDILSLPGFDTPEPPPIELETPTPKPEVERIAVLYGGSPLAFYPHFTQKLSAGTDNSFSVAVEPPGLEDVDVIIESDDESIFVVEPVIGGRANGFSVTGVSQGNAKLIVTCGHLTETIFVTIS